MTPTITDAVFLTLKIFILTGLGVYSLFAGVMIRQEQLMAAVLEESFEPVLRTLVLVHFASSLGLFFLALVLL